MLEDIVVNTQRVFEQFLPQNKKIQSMRTVYDLYRTMEKMVSDINKVSEHYLALKFDESYLETSTLGTTSSDKWRWVLNIDLEELNKSAKDYLMGLNCIAIEDGKGEFENYLFHIYNFKTFYGFVRDEYCVGLVSQSGFEMSTTTLSLDVTKENRNIKNFKKINLTTYEQRVALQSDLREKHIILKSELVQLKAYILENCSIEELL